MAILATAMTSQAEIITDPSVTAISTFTGGDSVDGFALSGTYLYTVSLGGNFGPQTVQGYVFSDVGSSTGVTQTLGGSGSVAGNWDAARAGVEYGTSADDNAFEAIMFNTALSYGTSPSVSVDIDVTSGQEYSLQMFFSDNSAVARRNFDVSIEGVVEVGTFEPQQGMGVTDPQAFGSIISHTFTAGDTALNLVLGGNGSFASGGDPNPIIQAFTLQAVPEPSSIILVGIALFGLVAFRRR